MNITFASYAVEKADLLNNYLLASSIRDFAGNMSDIPLRIYVPSNMDMHDEMNKFSGLNVVFSHYPAARNDIGYAFKSAAARACEADTETGNVIWMDRHMIVLAPCVDLLLNPLEMFAYRPPHLKLLGASADEPINQMWTTAYKIAGVDVSALFPIYTEVDREKIWPYFSAGHFSFRAEAGIMREWDVLFNQLAEHKDIQPFLDDAYGEYVKIFLHQIALTLIVLRKPSRDTLKALPLFYGYPTHLHGDIAKYYQPSQMDQLHTAFFSYYNGLPNMPISERLTSWIENNVKHYNNLAYSLTDG